VKSGEEQSQIALSWAFFGVAEVFSTWLKLIFFVTKL
jgi:hypothetical protein